MPSPSNLQQAIDQAGSPVKHLWNPSAPPWLPAVVKHEFVGWQKEQLASYETVSLADLSFHMRDLVLDGPDATKLLADTSVNNYKKFVVGQAKQFIAVSARGSMVADGILLREKEDRYVLTGPASSQSWVLFHAEQGDYDVEFTDIPTADFYDGPQLYFRFQLQGPNALDLVAKVFAGPLPETKFFHTTPVTLEGRNFLALRHGMVGQAGYEFIGENKDYEFVRETFLKAGEEFGIVPIGGKTYATNDTESGWIATYAPAIYTDPELKSYREWISMFTYEANYPLHGSYFSEDIEDYYVSPFELGYGGFMDLKHDFAGRDALVKAKDDDSLRTKVTFVLDAEQSREKLFGEPDDYFSTIAIDRIEADGKLVGTSWTASHQVRRGAVLALGLIDKGHAATGTEVEFIYGEHPGPGTDPNADLGFDRIKATVAPSPYDEYARTNYRKPI